MGTVGFPHVVAQFFEGEDFSEIFKGRIRNNYAGSLAGYGKTMLAPESFDGPHVWHNGKTLPQDAQKVRPARPQ